MSFEYENNREIGDIINGVISNKKTIGINKINLVILTHFLFLYLFIISLQFILKIVYLEGFLIYSNLHIGHFVVFFFKMTRHFE